MNFLKNAGKLIFLSWIPAIFRWTIAFYRWLFNTFMGFGNKVKLFAALPFALMAVIPVFFYIFPLLYLFHPDIGVFSDGYRMGMIHEWGPDGLAISPVTTYEGQMYLGYQSHEWNDPLTGKQVNPWRFSSSEATWEKYQHLSGQYVVVHYHQVWLQLNKFWGDTDFRIVDVEPIDPKLAPDQCGAMEPSRGVLDSRSAPLSGRLVRDNTSGNTFMTKSWEVQMQKGDGGGAPANLSILSPAVKDCADKFVRSGVMAQFIYDHAAFGMRNPTSQESPDVIVGIRKVSQNIPQ